MDTVAEFHHHFLTTLRSLCKDEVAFQKAVALINSEFSQRAAQLENHHVCSPSRCSRRLARCMAE